MDTIFNLILGYVTTLLSSVFTTTNMAKVWKVLIVAGVSIVFALLKSVIYPAITGLPSSDIATTIGVVFLSSQAFYATFSHDLAEQIEGNIGITEKPL